MAEPIFVPSTLNCTFATATLSEAVAESATDEPETVAPFAGAVSETEGAVLSTVNAIAEEVARLFEVSRATATIDLEPLEVAVLSHVTEYGEEVSSEPMMTPPIFKVTPATATSSD